MPVLQHHYSAGMIWVKRQASLPTTSAAKDVTGVGLRVQKLNFSRPLIRIKLRNRNNDSKKKQKRMVLEIRDHRFSYSEMKVKNFAQVQAEQIVMKQLKEKKRREHQRLKNIVVEVQVEEAFAVTVEIEHVVIVVVVKKIKNVNVVVKEIKNVNVVVKEIENVNVVVRENANINVVVRENENVIVVVMEIVNGNTVNVIKQST